MLWLLIDFLKVYTIDIMKFKTVAYNIYIYDKMNRRTYPEELRLAVVQAEVLAMGRHRLLQQKVRLINVQLHVVFVLLQSKQMTNAKDYNTCCHRL